MYFEKLTWRKDDPMFVSVNQIIPGTGQIRITMELTACIGLTHDDPIVMVFISCSMIQILWYQGWFLKIGEYIRFGIVSQQFK